MLTGKSAPPKRIEKAITDRTGLSVSCVVLTAKQLRAIIDGHPFADVATNGSRMMAHVLGGTPSDRRSSRTPWPATPTTPAPGPA